MKKTLFLLLFCFLCTLSYSIEDDDFQKNFNIAKQHLSQRRILKALPYLQYLNSKFPKNANLKYLIGVCYAEEEIVNPLTIKLLEDASEKSSLDYDPNSLEEKRVPIYVYYYLSIAYSQNKMCEEAKNAREKFVEIYPHKDPFYLEESEKWIEKCERMILKPKEDTIPRFPGFVPFSSAINNQDTMVSNVEDIAEDVEKKKPTLNIYPKHVVTKKVEFSTHSPLYGVQLGAYKEVVPVSRFSDMKNVDAFMDKDGLIRYVVGHFAIYSQAESLLKIIQERGYPDAFIVNVNNERKFRDEVVSVDNINIRASLKGKVQYRVQIGAFSEDISQQTANMYLKIDGIEENQGESYTFLTVGNFKTYEEAKAYLQAIKDIGIKDAFVVALNNGKKISLQQAKDFQNE